MIKLLIAELLALTVTTTAVAPYADPPVKEIAVETIVEAAPEPLPYTEAELDLMARVLCCECGDERIPDQVQLEVGAVLMNRLNYPEWFHYDTLEALVYSPGQYANLWWIETCTPDQRTIENAKRVLLGDHDVPDDVVWQASFPQQVWGMETWVYKHYDESWGEIYLCHAGK